MEDVVGRLELLLRKKSRHIDKSVQGNGMVILFREKGRYSRFAVYIVHLSVMVLIIF